jgi:predicted RNase H-like HicB family nuclease
MQVNSMQTENVPTVAVSSPAAATTSSGAAVSASTQSLSSGAEETQAAVYSTTVAGKNYSGSVVEETGGVYEASVPNMPGATATGSSVQSAENNLSVRIDTLV